MSLYVLRLWGFQQIRHTCWIASESRGTWSMHKGQRRDDVMARVPLPENYLWLCIAGSVWLTHWGAAIPVSQQDRLTLTSPCVSRLFLPNLISSTFVLSSCLWSISSLCTSDHADSVKATWCLHQLRSGNTCIAPTQCPKSVFSHTTLCLQASVWQTQSKLEANTTVSHNYGRCFQMPFCF